MSTKKTENVYLGLFHEAKTGNDLTAVKTCSQSEYGSVIYSKKWYSKVALKTLS